MAFLGDFTDFMIDRHKEKLLVDGGRLTADGTQPLETWKNKFHS